MDLDKHITEAREFLRHLISNTDNSGAIMFQTLFVSYLSKVRDGDNKSARKILKDLKQLGFVE